MKAHININYPNISRQMLVNIGGMPCGYYPASHAFSLLRFQGFQVKSRLHNGFLMEMQKESGNWIEAEIKHVPRKYWKP
jgi:hypothetical protein